MISHKVKVYPSKINLPKKNQLAWKIAEIASDNVKLDKAAVEMVINRIIDNASVAIASLNRKAVISSREMALKHPRKNGANLFGIDTKLKFDCEWAAWSNGTAVRELDFHDTFLAADYSHDYSLQLKKYHENQVLLQRYHLTMQPTHNQILILYLYQINLLHFFLDVLRPSLLKKLLPFYLKKL